MDEISVKALILEALNGGPLTSDQLEKKLGMEWTQFYAQLIDMIKDRFNPKGKVIQKKEGLSGPTTYRLA